jgi:hypothetical protein
LLLGLQLSQNGVVVPRARTLSVTEVADRGERERPSQSERGRAFLQSQGFQKSLGAAYELLLTATDVQAPEALN